MSDERRQRQQERLSGARPGLNRIIIYAVAGAMLVTGFYLINRRRRVAYDAFAKCLAAKQVTMYGLYWCEHCAEQKEMFGSSFQYVPYKECGIKGSTKEETSCIEAGVKNFPTWQFPDGSRAEGSKPLKYLSEKSGCSLQ